MGNCTSTPEAGPEDPVVIRRKLLLTHRTYGRQAGKVILTMICSWVVRGGKSVGG